VVVCVYMCACLCVFVWGIYPDNDIMSHHRLVRAFIASDVGTRLVSQTRLVSDAQKGSITRGASLGV